MDKIEAVHTEVKNNKPHFEVKDIKKQIVKDILPTDSDVEQRCEKARQDAHTLGAELKRGISMDIKKLSESFQFIEESYGTGAPAFEFFDSPKDVAVVSEDFGAEHVGEPEHAEHSYPIIGRATGVFAPIGVMSRNNRIYDEDHYDYLLGNQQLVDRINSRGMMGTIGHHDKRVDDEDLALGKVSHIVSDLHIVEEADGSRNLYGTLEILDTPAGRLLKTYYDSGLPLFVSSRGGGNLLPVPHESYKRVDKTKYFLETFDIVHNPGFLQAKPVYETADMKKVMDYDEKIANVENQRRKINKDIEDGKDLEKNHHLRDTSDYVLKGLNKRRDQAMNEDSIDRLARLMGDFMEVITESKKADKPEDDEAKEAPEKKEAKEKKEASEKHEAPIKEEKEDKKKKDEEDLPEDEKNEEAEDAVAASVSEAKKQELSVDEKVAKVMDPRSGLTDKDDPNATQGKLFPEKDVRNMVQAGEDFKNLGKQLRDDFAKNHPYKKPKAAKVKAEQVPMFDKIGEDMDIAGELAQAFRQEKEQEPEIRCFQDVWHAKAIADELKKAHQELKDMKDEKK